MQEKKLAHIWHEIFHNVKCLHALEDYTLYIKMKTLLKSFQVIKEKNTITST